MNKLHLYKMTTWKDFNNKWHCNDITNLSCKSAKWYAPMRILNLSVEEYINLLINKFHAKGLNYNLKTDYLGFYFEKENYASSFCAYVNLIAKKKSFWCF